jgi:hypothetical protein
MSPVKSKGGVAGFFFHDIRLSDNQIKYKWRAVRSTGVVVWWWCKRPDWTYIYVYIRTLTHGTNNLISCTFGCVILHTRDIVAQRLYLTQSYWSQFLHLIALDSIREVGSWDFIYIHALWEMMSIRKFFFVLLSWKKKNMFFVYPWVAAFAATLLLLSFHIIALDRICYWI